MQVTVTNISPAPVPLTECYTTIQPGMSISFQRSGNQLAQMKGLIDAISNGLVTCTVTPTAAEVASGLLAPPEAVEAQDIAPVAVDREVSPAVLLRARFAAGASPGNPDDVTVFAAGYLPFKFRVVDAWALISTAVGASELNVYTRAAGAGTLLSGPISSAATGRAQTSGPDVSAVAIPGATEGLFIRRDDQAVEGEVFLLCRIES